MAYDRLNDRYIIMPTDARRNTVQRDALRLEAAAAINNYFHACKMSRVLGSLTLDQLLTNCFQLRNVMQFCEYCDDHLELYEARKFIMKHVSMKIKEFIDSRE